MEVRALDVPPDGVAAGVLAGIGGTPMVDLSGLASPGSARILAKLEWANPTGSMKDRMAASVIAGAEARGDLRPGDTVVEYTAGTTGISLACVCAARGYGFHAVFSDAFSDEKRHTMQAFGATVEDIPSDGGRITEQLIKAMIARAGEVSARPGHWWCDQLNNHDAVTGYHALGEEMWQQSDGRVDAFVHTVSTAHSIHGAARALRAHRPDIEVIAVEPAESAVLSGGPTGAHRIEGIGIGFVPPLWDPREVDAIEQVASEAAMDMSRRLARDRGLLA
ncbi:PLP-dependent cysteine synthase family protein, partial [Paraconexibacter sp.]|uniref:PLP-dependent cysteine synthase family protein n=1 Tax=Paraconexibacter sp. TaxID=2949640 RepID=UPI00356492AD